MILQPFDTTWVSNLLFKLVLLATLLGCTPSSQDKILRDDCGSEVVVSDTSVISAYDDYYRDFWGAERGELELLFRNCGDEILVYENLPAGVFGGNTYVYFDVDTLNPGKAIVFQ